MYNSGMTFAAVHDQSPEIYSEVAFILMIQSEVRILVGGMPRIQAQPCTYAQVGPSMHPEAIRVLIIITAIFVSIDFCNPPLRIG